MTNAGYVESIEKQSSTACQDAKNWQDQNMSNTTVGSGDGHNARRNKVVCGKIGERKSAGKWRKETVLGLGAQDENELYCKKAGSYTGG